MSIALTGVAFALALGQAGIVSRWLWLPYLWQATEVARGVWLPAMGARPAAIGVRQLIVKIVFVGLFIALW